MLGVEHILNQLMSLGNDEVVHAQVDIFAREPLLHVVFFTVLLLHA